VRALARLKCSSLPCQPTLEFLAVHERNSINIIAYSGKVKSTFIVTRESLNARNSMAEHRRIVAFCWLMQGVGNVRRLRKRIRSIARVGRNNQGALRRIFFKHGPLTDSTKHPLSPAKHGYAQMSWPGLKENSYSSVPLHAAQYRLRPTALAND
jgi:hypothetical protein